MTDDPTVREVWGTLPDDIRKDVYQITDAIINFKKSRDRLKKKVYEELNDDQQTVIFYLIGDALDNGGHPIDDGKDLLIIGFDKFIAIEENKMRNSATGKRKSELVKFLLKSNTKGIDRANLGFYLGTTQGYFENKLVRNSFSLEDIIAIAGVCGYSVTITGDDNQTVKVLTPDEFLSNEANERLSMADDKLREMHKTEYEELLKRAEELNSIYNFSDES